MTAPAPHRVTLLAAGDDRLAALMRPIATAALTAGFAVDVIATTEAQRAAAEAAGARPVPFQAGSGLNPMTAGDAAGRLAAMFREAPPDLVHAIGIRAAILAGSAAALARIERRVYGPTGLGQPVGLLARGQELAARALLRGPLAGAHTRFLLETEDEAAGLGFAATEPTRIVVAGRETAEIAAAAVGLYRALLADTDPTGTGAAEPRSA